MRVTVTWDLDVKCVSAYAYECGQKGEALAMIVDQSGADAPLVTVGIEVRAGIWTAVEVRDFSLDVLRRVYGTAAGDVATGVVLEVSNHLISREVTQL